jgi:hypothetical protein
VVALRDLPAVVNRPAAAGGNEENDMNRKRLERMTDNELAMVAAVLLATTDNWSENETDGQSLGERRLELAYDAVIVEGERRMGSDEFTTLLISKRIPVEWFE